MRYGTLAALTLLLASQAPAPRSQVFGGRVLRLDPARRWFEMQGGGSKLHPTLRVYPDGKTRWLRTTAKRWFRVNDSVRVTVVSRPDGSFRALQIELQPAAAQPISGESVPASKP